MCGPVSAHVRGTHCVSTRNLRELAPRPQRKSLHRRMELFSGLRGVCLAASRRFSQRRCRGLRARIGVARMRRFRLAILRRPNARAANGFSATAAAEQTFAHVRPVGSRMQTRLTRSRRCGSQKAPSAGADDAWSAKSGYPTTAFRARRRCAAGAGESSASRNFHSPAVLLAADGVTGAQHASRPQNWFAYRWAQRGKIYRLRSGRPRDYSVPLKRLATPTSPGTP